MRLPVNSKLFFLLQHWPITRSIRCYTLCNSSHLAADDLLTACGNMHNTHISSSIIEVFQKEMMKSHFFHTSLTELANISNITTMCSIFCPLFLKNIDLFVHLDQCTFQHIQSQWILEAERNSRKNKKRQNKKLHNSHHLRLVVLLAILNNKLRLDI